MGAIAVTLGLVLQHSFYPISKNDERRFMRKKVKKKGPNGLTILAFDTALQARLSIGRNDQLHAHINIVGVSHGVAVCLVDLLPFVT